MNNIDISKIKAGDWVQLNGGSWYEADYEEGKVDGFDIADLNDAGWITAHRPAASEPAEEEPIDEYKRTMLGCGDNLKEWQAEPEPLEWLTEGEVRGYMDADYNKGDAQELNQILTRKLRTDPDFRAKVRRAVEQQEQEEDYGNR